MNESSYVDLFKVNSIDFCRYMFRSKEHQVLTVRFYIWKWILIWMCYVGGVKICGVANIIIAPLCRCACYVLTLLFVNNSRSHRKSNEEEKKCCSENKIAKAMKTEPEKRAHTHKMKNFATKIYYCVIKCVWRCFRTLLAKLSFTRYCVHFATTI